MVTEILAKIVPDLSQVESATDETVEIDADMQAQSGGGGGSSGGGGGDALSGLLSTTSVIAGLIGIVVGLVAGLEPIQAILDLLLSTFQIILFPVANLLFTVLRPVLLGLLKALPFIQSFFQDPLSALAGLLDGLGGIIGSVLETAISNIRNAFTPSGRDDLGQATLRGAVQTNPLLGGFVQGLSFLGSQLGLGGDGQVSQGAQNNSTTLILDSLDPVAQTDLINTATRNQTGRTR